MNKLKLNAMLKWARKRKNQRLNKPLAKHATETLGRVTAGVNHKEMESK